MEQNIFPPLSKAMWPRINCCYSIQFSNHKNEHNIISSRVISSHVGPMYIKTPYISLESVNSARTRNFKSFTISFISLLYIYAMLCYS